MGEQDPEQDAATAGTLLHSRRRLRLGMIGGGRPGAIGHAHRMAAMLDGKWDVVAGVFSRNPETNQRTGADWRVPPDRCYSDFAEMAVSEAGRGDRVDAVTICTHNDTHLPIAMTFLERGFHVICDKPLTTSVEGAERLVQATKEAGVIFAVTYTYSGYPMVRMARDMILDGELGDLRSINVEYVSQYQSSPPKPDDWDDWQNDPFLSGPLGVVAGTGTHAAHMASFVSGLEISELSAELSSLVPGHRLDDHATMHVRYSNGARGYMWITTVAPGNENGLRFRIFGSRGGLDWSQEHPNHLRFSPLEQQSTVLTRGGFRQSSGAREATRVRSGSPEGYLEAFANIYTEIADAIQAGSGAARTWNFPTVEDGLRGVQFMFAALTSSQAGGKFVPLRR